MASHVRCDMAATSHGVRNDKPSFGKIQALELQCRAPIITIDMTQSLCPRRRGAAIQKVAPVARWTAYCKKESGDAMETNRRLYKSIEPTTGACWEFPVCSLMVLYERSRTRLGFGTAYEHTALGVPPGHASRRRTGKPCSKANSLACRGRRLPFRTL